MRRKTKVFLHFLFGMLLSVTIFLQSTTDVFDINTRFDVPGIESDWTPDNCLYKSPNLNIMVCS